MISKKCVKAINDQMNQEFFAAFLYQAMANDAMDKGFKGAANWFNMQFKEEMEHGFKFAKYLEDQGQKVMITGMEAPKTEWPNLLAMFKDALEHEKLVTSLIVEIAKLAAKEQDFATQNMLQWFIDEQVEEEASVSDVIWMLEMSKDSKGALFMADRTLGKREDD